MEKSIWINLPVNNIEKSKAFFKAIGFSFNSDKDNDVMACMTVIPNSAVVMLFEASVLKTFIQTEITDTSQSVEMIISFDASNREEVDILAENVLKAGGNLFSAPAESHGWLYGCAFADLDGHRWNILYRDLSKLTKK